MAAATETARYYRLRAEECRTLAELDREAHTRDLLIEVAQSYERIARSLDAIAESKVILSRPEPDPFKAAS